MPVYQTPEPITAAVEVAAGRIRVTASDRVDTTVEVHPHNERSDKDVQAAEETQVEYAQGRLTVRVPKRRLRSFIGPGPALDIDIEVPTESALDVSAWADTTCLGRFGDVTVESAAGDISVERAGDLRLKTSAGDITVGRVDGHGDLNVAAGAIRVDEVEGSLVAKASTGDVTVGETTGDLRLNAAYGTVRVGRTLTTAVVKTAHGAVRVAEAVSGSIVLDSGYGDLEIGIAEGTAAWLDVSSRHGVVRSDLAATDAPAAPDRTVEVRARTQHGDVIVRRA